ncbi:hypothetical protein, partial [Novosphingobium sp. CCH12-A3]|uniref:hypothetical protein n=1 Tax=Novosphingobium sp. CCH12-A3 TaxID=1768752 RepID=UPI001E5C1D66
VGADVACAAGDENGNLRHLEHLQQQYVQVCQQGFTLVGRTFPSRSPADSNASQSGNFEHLHRCAMA